MSLRREPNRAWHRYEHRRFVHQIALFGLLGLALCVFGWGWRLTQFWSLPSAELVVIAPFLLGMLLSWLCFYDAHRALHQAAYQSFHLDPLAGRPAGPQGV